MREMSASLACRENQSEEIGPTDKNLLGKVEYFVSVDTQVEVKL